MEATRTAALVAALVIATGLAAQDTPDWWPQPLTEAAADSAVDILYHRPLAQFNHPTTGKPKQVASVLCMPSGRYYRVVLDHGAIPEGACLQLTEPVLP